MKSWATVLAGIGFAFAALVVWLTVKVGQGDLDRQDKFASVVSMYVGPRRPVADRDYPGSDAQATTSAGCGGSTQR